MAVSRRLRELVSLLREAKPIWVCIGGIGLAWAVGLGFAGDAVSRIRYASLVLQALGLCVVSFGLIGLRQRFGHQPFSTVAAAWFRRLRFVLLPSRRVSANANLNATLGGVALAGRARVDVDAGPNSSPERRVEILEWKVKALRQDVDELDERLTADTRQLRTSVDQHRREVSSQIAHVEHSVNTLAVEGLPYEWVGIIWVAFGLVTGSLPDKDVQRVVDFVGLLF